MKICTNETKPLIKTLTIMMFLYSGLFADSIFVVMKNQVEHNGKFIRHNAAGLTITSDKSPKALTLSYDLITSIALYGMQIAGNINDRAIDSVVDIHKKVVEELNKPIIEKQEEERRLAERIERVKREIKEQETLRQKEKNEEIQAARLSLLPPVQPVKEPESIKASEVGVIAGIAFVVLGAYLTIDRAISHTDYPDNIDPPTRFYVGYAVDLTVLVSGIVLLTR